MSEPSFEFPASVKVHHPDQQELRRLKAAAEHAAHVAAMAELGVAAAELKVERTRAAERNAMAAVPDAQAQLEQATCEAAEAAKLLENYLAAFEMEG